MATVRIPATQQSFRVGKVVCLGRNYAEHIRELNNPVPDRPVLFIKPATSIIPSGGTVVIPAYSNDCHHEVELAVLIGCPAKNLSTDRAMECVAGYGVAVDLTLRDVQSKLKTRGLPWEVAKGFDTACPLSDFVPADRIADPQDLQLRLKVNGEVRQEGSTALMLRRLPEILAEISAIFTLEPGDVVLTGTPAGVGPLRSGDRVEAEIDALVELSVTVA